MRTRMRMRTRTRTRSPSPPVPPRRARTNRKNRMDNQRKTTTNNKHQEENNKNNNNNDNEGKVQGEADVRTCGERTRDVGVIVALALLPAVLALAMGGFKPSREKESIVCSGLLSLVGFFACKRLIPVVARANLAKGLFGKDINKRGTEGGEIPIPESLGLATGLVHIVCIVLFQVIHTHFLRPPPSSQRHHEGWWSCLKDALLGPSDSPYPASSPSYLLPQHGLDDWTEKWLIQYNSALASISLMVFLGFADDVLDIPWRTKLVLPTVATLPIIAAYTGSTAILIPLPLRDLVGCSLVDLGVLYQIFMVLVVVFCTNSINILAGLNGLEAGQTLIIAGAVLLFNVTKLSSIVALPELTLEDVRVRDAHLFSAYITLPLVAVTAALLLFNYYPSRVFVGDTYTYFAGMALAVSGILGHFSETLLVFFIPQIINFVYSTPQLFKVVPCPRHRLPVYDRETGLLHPSRRQDGGYNLNLVTLFLRLFGPCTEKQLCNRILFFQFVCCAFGFALRHVLAGVYK